jgi:hypothetical protein
MDERYLELLEQQNKILASMVEKQEDDGSHTKTPNTFSDYTPLHGPGGIWTGPGLERDVISAHVRPQGLASALRLLPTVDVNPQFGILTGFTAGDDDDSTYWVDVHCDDVPAGYMKSCTLTAQFGALRVDSKTIDMDDVMLRLHRGDFTDLVLNGELLGMTGLNPADTSQGDVLNLVTASEMVQMGVQTERLLSRAVWQGAVANRQFPGLAAQIATGQVDVNTGATCPAADSDVKDFALDFVGGAGRDIVEYMSMLEFYLNYNAMTMGLDPVEWVIAMRPELWHELTAVWPCAYNTTRCVNAAVGAGGASQTVIDGRENIQERDNMRNSMSIIINGRTYPVVVDTGIFEHNNINNANLNPAQFASSIFFVPLTIRGGLPVTYRQYLDYRQAQRDVSMANGKLDVWWTDNGVYAWAVEQTKWCYKFSLKSQQRIVLRAPHLAGRIDNVAYEPLQHLRDPNPNDPYFADGGVSLRGTAASRSAVWL